MRVYYYNTRNVQFMWQKWEEGLMPAHLLYGATLLPEHGIELVMHQSTDERARWRLMLHTAWKVLTCREHYDVLYGTAFRGLELIILLRALHLYRHRIVVWHHQPIEKSKNKVREAIARLFYRGIDDMFFFSEKIIADSLKSKKAHAERMHLVHWGADLDFYDRIRNDSLEKRQGFVSTGKELRDHTTLVKAFNRTNERFDVYTLNYIGDKNPDTALETIPLNSNIHVHYTDGSLIPFELAKEVNRADCVVICSRATNYTVGLTTLVEAMALGLPMICSRNPQMPFDVETEGCGISVDYGDVDGWTKAIEYMASHPDEAQRMGRKARQMAEEVYNNRNCAREVAEVIKGKNNKKTVNSANTSHLYMPRTLGEAPKYIYGGVAANSDLVILPDFTRQPNDFIHKLMKFLFVGRLPLSAGTAARLTGFDGYRQLTRITANDRLILDGVSNLHTLKAIRHIVPKATHCYDYFNNSLRFVYKKADIRKITQQIKTMGYQLATFDPSDAKEYGMLYTEQYYRFPEAITTSQGDNDEYDFFFCGVSKDRSKRLADLRQMLESKGFRCQFIVVENANERISYEKYLEYLSKSRCVVDLMQEGQTGITRRPVEALFWNKKLLTENKHIASYDFYDEANICILSPDTADEIEKFMSTPHKEVPTDIKTRYDINHWLGYFK